ncbi:MAG TPA: hypothetical protein VMV69_06755 [Pirellulales bacterium]|nr:hypothetical protein [Pirellulales bacterium]
MKRLKKWLIWGVLGIVATIACLGIYVALASWRAGARLEALLTPIREAGDPLGLADLARAPIPPENNAAVFLRRAENDLQALGKEFLPLDVESSGHYRDDRLTDSGAAIIRGALDAYPNVLPLIEQAASSSDYDPQYDYTLPPADFQERYLLRPQAIRQVARWLQWRSDLLRHEGQSEAALRNDLLLWRLIPHFDREPLIVGRLVAIALRGRAVHMTAQLLADEPISTELRQELDRELAKHLDPKPILWALKSERAFGIDYFQYFYDSAVAGWWFKDDECDYLELLSGQLELAAAPRYQVAPRLAKRKLKSAGVGALTALVAPATQALRDAEDRVRAGVQCLRVLAALLAYVERTGDERPELAALGLPVEWTTDPYDGRPLRFKKTERGWLVYAVGNNLKDDGGDLKDRADVGVGPEGLEPIRRVP